MDFFLLGGLMGLFILISRCGIISERINRFSGQWALISCGAVGPLSFWSWFPLNSKCAGVNTDSVEIICNPATYHVIPSQFNDRLQCQPTGSLLLSNIVMSDEGTFVCHLPNGSDSQTVLDVKTGCHNNLHVTFLRLSESTSGLSCSHCSSEAYPNTFWWTVNSRRLGNPRWAAKSMSGALVTFHSSIPGMASGRWECHSHFNSSWVSEICINKRKKDRGVASTKTSTLPSSSSSHFSFSLTTVAPPAGLGVKRIATYIWALAVAGLILLLTILGMCLCIWKRKSRGRKNCSMKDPFRRNEEISERENLDERCVSLHYAQLVHPQRKSTFAWMSDSATVYEVIV